MIFFVTGGSRGIGAAIVLEAIGLGHDGAFTYWNHAELADRVVARARGGGRGRIILVSSLGHGGVTGQVSYAASKAGLLGLSGSLAREYGRRGLTSNVVVPGFIETDMTSDATELREFWTRFCPAGRVGTPGDVASVVMFLASDAASFVNGQVIPVTAGLDWAP